MHHKPNKLRMIAIVFVLGGCAAGLYAQMPGPTPANVFQPVDRTITSVPAGPEVLARQPVAVDIQQLARIPVGGTLNLGLFGDGPITGVVERVDRRGPRNVTIVGRHDGPRRGSFTFVVHGTAVVGVVRFPDVGEVGQLGFTAEGVHLVQRIDPSRYPTLACFFGETAPAEPPIAPTAPARPASDTEAARGGCEPLPPVHDLLLVYTHLARQVMGSTDAAIARCQLAVEVGNEAYANSAIDVRLRLVHTMEVEYDEPGDIGAWLDWLEASTLIADARDEYRADLVSMLTYGGSGLGNCGPGPGRVYSIVQWSRAVSTWTLVHEIGHNHGCAHDRAHSSGDCADASYAYGHRFMGSDGIEYGTVMAYGDNRIDHFSNPDIEYMGSPTGVPIGEPGEAHCARQHINEIYSAEEFRTTRYDIWVDLAHTSTEFGSYLFPFDTVTEGVDRILNGDGATELPNLWIVTGSYDETITVDKTMIVRSCGGLVTIGE
jgi:hypothetical protein